ncbi:30S ribosomal protein S16 [Candidatus Uhrbacteria bacterium]|nr:30S ribosomal protein S16 [Candidatus Uhrbacteria bacterium]
MLSIRLSRMGHKNQPVYRVVVMPKHRDPKAVVTEILGHFNPRKNPRELVLDAERVKYWLSKGAQPTETVWNLLVDEKIIEGKKKAVTNITKRHAKRMEDAKVKAAA